ncbi:UNVERIFIED_CONTAM: hypothetical protein HDU68_009097 [Siphonaria sp. JEL0065]|nr:hypothetical protein HDU68_009097 [Siphonaria sp. JEL0065]
MTSQEGRQYIPMNTVDRVGHTKTAFQKLAKTLASKAKCTMCPTYYTVSPAKDFPLPKVTKQTTSYPNSLPPATVDWFPAPDMTLYDLKETRMNDLNEILRNKELLLEGIEEGESGND